MAVGPPLPRQYAPLPRSEPKSRSESWQWTQHIPLPAAPAARSCLAPTRIFFGVKLWREVRALPIPFLAERTPVQCPLPTRRWLPLL